MTPTDFVDGGAGVHQENQTKKKKNQKNWDTNFKLKLNTEFNRSCTFCKETNVYGVKVMLKLRFSIFLVKKNPMPTF